MAGAVIRTSFAMLACMLAPVFTVLAREAEVKLIGPPLAPRSQDLLRQKEHVADTGAASAEGDAWWYVYLDAGSPRNHGVWSNVVPAHGHKMLRIDLADPTGPASGATAIRIDIAFTAVGWCGIGVSSNAGYWGDRPDQGFDLRRARLLAFRARGVAGGERIRIKAAVAGDQPFGDSAPLPIDSGWLQLSVDWRDYRIGTDGRDLSRVITPFMLIATDKHNPSGRLTVFLDDVRYEMAP